MHSPKFDTLYVISGIKRIHEGKSSDPMADPEGTRGGGGVYGLHTHHLIFQKNKTKQKSCIVKLKIRKKQEKIRKKVVCVYMFI